MKTGLATYEDVMKKCIFRMVLENRRRRGM
jgi:hypothetical protein